ncbi:uncharacterized protein LOC9661629 [Selaginella moellendorffii]|uniref:uncharacterized protein LOC9661629 n=1 Tax=Selaginella moellendorffii TaxID=88036 RepID=UPI000D1CAE1C|nr:uncharacterized protein LOC9661629 [Selaginella moellendorffii]|eukprot:XP_002963133.2 uncharacterized protein LOC9661629 [Selaginella moellendorffii]
MVAQHKSYPICPPWLKPLISAKFFEPCNNHSSSSSSPAAGETAASTSAARIECNLYCLDCMDEPLCFGCTFCHKNHHVVQIRRSSYHDVIRVSEIQKVLDLSGIQSYIINSARVVFLNGRPQTKLAKGVTKTCEICERSLNESFRYCSLGCKLQGISKHNDLTFTVQPKPQVGNGNHRVYPEDGVSHKRSRSRKKLKLDTQQIQSQQHQELLATPTPGDQEKIATPNNAPSAPADLPVEEAADRGEKTENVMEEKEFEEEEHGDGEMSQQRLGLVGICPSTPPQVVTWTEGIFPGRQRARKGTPHRSHLGSGLTLGEARG